MLATIDVMCTNDRCRKRQNCVRYLAFPFLEQKRAFFSANGCYMFVDRAGKGDTRRLSAVDAENTRNARIKASDPEEGKE